MPTYPAEYDKPAVDYKAVHKKIRAVERLIVVIVLIARLF